MSQSRVITQTPTITANGIYHANDCIGGKMVLTDIMIEGGVGTLFDLLVKDLINQKPELEVVIFSSNPSAATLTDHAAIAFSTDIAKVVGIIHVKTADWVTVGGMGLASVLVPRTIAGAAGSNNLYAAAMVVGTPTYTATNQLIFNFGLED